MSEDQKPNLLKQLLAQKAAARKNGRIGILADNDLSRRFRVGEKAQPILRRGGRNGSGKP